MHLSVCQFVFRFLESLSSTYFLLDMTAQDTDHVLLASDPVFSDEQYEKVYTFYSSYVCRLFKFD